MRILSSGRTGVSASVGDLQEMVASLEAQLVSLYEEREQSGLFDAVDHDDIYIAKIARGADTIQSLEETIEGLNAQLVALYDEKVAGEAPGDALAQAHATIDNLNAQLCDLYAERAEQSADNAAESNDLLVTIDSLNAQLCDLYDHQSEGHDALQLTVESLEAQLVALYDEKVAAAPAGSSDESALMVESLNAQVVALIDEKMALEEELAKSRAAVERFKGRMHKVLESIVDNAVFAD
ncbi:MAG: hypothetical protein ACE366_20355 [Bradymonadia bacterium]